jgi:hypothetical protein
MSDSNDSPPIPGLLSILAGVLLGTALVIGALALAISRITVLHEQYCNFKSWAFSKPVLKTKNVPEVAAGYSRPGGAAWGRFEAPDEDSCVRPDSGMEFVKGTAHFFTTRKDYVADASGYSLREEKPDLICYTVWAANTSYTTTTVIAGRIEVYQRPICHE